MHEQRLSEGKLAEVFTHGEHVMKLFRMGGKERAFREARHLALLEARGVAAPRVVNVEQVGERWGVVMTRLDGPTLGKFALATPDNYAPAMASFVRLHIGLHGCSGAGLVPARQKLVEALGRAPGVNELLRGVLLERLYALPDGEQLLHGDFHPFNIIGDANTATAIDWQEACCGPPAADICRTWLQLQGLGEDIAEAYLRAYARAAPDAPSRELVMLWLPVIAGAMLSEDLPHEAERLLQLARGGDIRQVI